MPRERESGMPTKNIIILAVVFSLLGHALILSATGFFDSSFKRRPDTVITVELEDDDALQKAVEKIPPEVIPSTSPKTIPAHNAEQITDYDDPEEETIALDSEDERFVPYLGTVKKRIERIWTYPAQAFEQKSEGVSTVMFSLDRSGALMESRIVASSGVAMLDRETMNVIRGAAPYAPFPPDLNLARLNIIATFQYTFLQ